MKAIKNWFLEKEGYGIKRIKEMQKAGYEVIKETEKALLVRWNDTGNKLWVPKSCLIDEWETKFSPKAIGGAYHEYLEITAKKAYDENKLFEKFTIKSGRNCYKGCAFMHQWTTKELVKVLDDYKIEYMSKKEFVKTL